MEEQPVIRRRGRLRPPVLTLEAPTGLPDGSYVVVRIFVVPKDTKQDREPAPAPTTDSDS